MPAIDEMKIEELRALLEQDVQEEIDLLNVEKSMNYTLADAIREGSSVTDQQLGGYCSDDGKLCAMSAALLAVKARRLI